MCTYSRIKIVPRFVIVIIVICASSGAIAQINTVPKFIEKYIQIDATKAQQSPKLHARLNFFEDKILTTRSDMKVNNDGFEDHTMLGFEQRLGVVRAKVTYKLHRFSYSNWEDKSENVAMDDSYRSMHFRHLQTNEARINSLDLPFKFSAAHFVLSFSQTDRIDVVDSIDAYRFISELNPLKISATWRNIGTGVWSNFIAEYRPLDRWKLRYSYRNEGIDKQRRFRSEYAEKGYRFTCENAAMTDMENQTHISSAIGIGKETKLAAVSLRLEHDGKIDNSMLIFKVETDNPFW